MAAINSTTRGSIVYLSCLSSEVIHQNSESSIYDTFYLYGWPHIVYLWLKFSDVIICTNTEPRCKLRNNREFRITLMIFETYFRKKGKKLSTAKTCIAFINRKERQGNKNLRTNFSMTMVSLILYCKRSFL